MEGDQKNLNGHVFSIDPKTNTLKLRPDVDLLRHALIDFKVTEVQKLVYAGDHVKVKRVRIRVRVRVEVEVKVRD